MQTPATAALDAAGVDYRVTEYEVPDGGYGDALVHALDLDPDTVGKTLVAVLDDGRHVSGGRRGLELSMAPEDLVRATAAAVGPIAT